MPTGRRPKPTTIKLVEGVRSSRINTDEPAAAESEPSPPSWSAEEWASEWLAIWERVCRQLRPMGLLHGVDQDALVALVTSIHEYDRLARALVRAPAIIRSNEGTPEANPVGRALRQCSAEVARWCSHFGMTPAERGRISRSAVQPQQVPHDDLAG